MSVVLTLLMGMFFSPLLAASWLSAVPQAIASIPGLSFLGQQAASFFGKIIYSGFSQASMIASATLIFFMSAIVMPMRFILKKGVKTIMQTHSSNAEPDDAGNVSQNKLEIVNKNVTQTQAEELALFAGEVGIQKLGPYLSRKDLHTFYRPLARVLHPDKGGEPGLLEDSRICPHNKEMEGILKKSNQALKLSQYNQAEIQSAFEIGKKNYQCLMILKKNYENIKLLKQQIEESTQKTKEIAQKEKEAKKEIERLRKEIEKADKRNQQIQAAASKDPAKAASQPDTSLQPSSLVLSDQTEAKSEPTASTKAQSSFSLLTSPSLFLCPSIPSPVHTDATSAPQKKNTH